MPAQAVLIFAHPYSGRSLANSLLSDAVADLPFLVRRDLYNLYPDFDLDVAAERAALAAADLVVMQHPMFWYSVPALLKLWIDEVFGFGWAYGEGGTALRGKAFQWVVTTGGSDEAYSERGMHANGFDTYVAPMRQTALFCGMNWLDPLILHNAHQDRERVARFAQEYRGRLEKLYATLPSTVERGA